MSRKMSSLNFTLISTTILIITLTQEIKASGVFELELLQLEQLDLKLNANFKNNSSKTYNEQQVQNNNNQNSQYEDSQNLIRIFVCLKEAFTSQLDGPCTFGNASLTLERDSINTRNVDQTLNSTKHHGSQLTNLVRILFTFRWTVSISFILFFL